MKKKIVISMTIIPVLLMGWLFMTNKSSNQETIIREYKAHKGNLMVGIYSEGSINSIADEQFTDYNLKFKEYVVSVGDKVSVGDLIGYYDQKQLADTKNNLKLEVGQKENIVNNYKNSLNMLKQNKENEINLIKNETNQLYDSKISNQQSIVDDLNSQLETTNNQINDANNRISELQNEKSQRAAIIGDYDMQITGLKLQLEDINNRLASASDDEKVALEIEQSDVSRQIAKIEQSRSELLAKDYDNLIAQINVDLNTLNSAVVNNQNLKNQAQSKLDEYKKQKQIQVNNDNTKINQISDKYQKDIVIKQKDVENSELELSIATKKYNDFNSEHKDNKIYAKYSGIVMKADQKANTLCTPDQPIIAISNQDKLTLNLNVDSSDISDIEIGQKVSFYVDSDQSKNYYGEVSKISNLTNDKGQARVVVNIEQYDDLFIGSGANATIVIKEKNDVLVLDGKAIYIKDKKQYTKVLDENNKVVEIEIKTGFSDGRSYEILSGLQVDQICITEE